MNGYLRRLVDRATSNKELENNKIGKYSITPQHGKDLFQYIVNRDIGWFNKIHLCTISIDSLLKTVTVGFNREFQINREVQQLHDFFYNEYCDFDITFKNI